MTRLAVQITALVAAWVSLAPTAAQAVRDNAAPGPSSAAREGVAHLGRLLQDSGWWAHLHGAVPWEQRPRRGLDTIEELCARFGWDAPGDRFWIDSVRAVRTVPPWDLPGRFDALVHVLSERYALTEPQQQLLSELIARGGSAVIAHHGGRLLQIGLEARLTWAAGESFTPEQVARWCGELQPVVDEARRELDDGTRELMQALDPAQRATLETDLGVVHQRLDGLREVARGWADGGWQPADWGLAGADPARGAGEAAPGESSSPAGAVPPAGEPASRPSVAENDDAWASYVREFIGRYQLDDAQQARAWSVYRELKSRADQVRQRLGPAEPVSSTRGSDEVGPSAPPGVRSRAAERAARIADLFKQLRRRLERLPTRAQQRAAP